MTDKEYRSIKSNVLKIFNKSMSMAFDFITEKGYRITYMGWDEFSRKDLEEYRTGANYLQSVKPFYKKSFEDFMSMLDALDVDNICLVTKDDIKEFKTKFNEAYAKLCSDVEIRHRRIDELRKELQQLEHEERCSRT